MCKYPNQQMAFAGLAFKTPISGDFLAVKLVEFTFALIM